MADLYRRGSHYLICDRTGLKTRVEDIRREWTGALVRKDHWEPRHPQDFVRIKRAQEGGPALPSRPEPAWQFTGALTTSTTAEVVAGETTIPVASSVRFEIGDTVSIILSTKEQHRAAVQAVPDASSIEIQPALPYSADSGALVTNFSAINEPDIG